MNIAINCRSFLKKEYTGIGRYALNLVGTLGTIDKNNTYWLYAKKRFFDFKRRLPEFSSPNIKAKYDFGFWKTERSLRGMDIYHAPSPEFLEAGNVKTIVTIHDLIYKTYPQGHTEATQRILDEQLKQIVARADRIICCSQSTIHDLLKFFDYDKHRVHLVYQGVDKEFFFPLEKHSVLQARARVKNLGVGGPFVLFVGTVEPRKNLSNLLIAFEMLKRKERYEGQLVIVGSRGWMMEGLEAQIDNLGISKDCLFLDYVEDQDLSILYNLADVFVYPSFYEGFGFPVLEAMSCGAAVVTSNVSACAEVAGQAALTADPNSPEQIFSFIKDVTGDQEFRASLRRKSIERSRQFSFQKTAEQTLEVYKMTASE